MGIGKQHSGYRSFQYLRPGVDYRSFPTAAEIDRVPPFVVRLSPEKEKRAEKIARESVMISLHDHLGTFPDPVSDTPAYVREGRMATAFEGLAQSHWDCVFDNMMDGICQIESKRGWKWTEVLHDLGMRICDIAHQEAVFHATTVDDILRAHREGRIAWVASIEGAAPIENELDRIEILYGFGVRLLGVTYSESNALGSGLKEAKDGGLTAFGKRAVERMNQVGMLVDCSHCGDQTTLDVVEASGKPIVLSHIGARALWNTSRMAPDDVLKACADKGGIIGIEAAPHTTLTAAHPRHNLESYMEHFEYVKDLVGIDHVSFGPDTLYGDHVGLHHVYKVSLSIQESRKTSEGGPPPYEEVDYVEGVENPTEASYNIVRWLVAHDYSNEQIAKVVGGNSLRLLKEVWA
ncbi:MAG TPA: membrane dipeptidase [Vicinamibacteria bacterium]|nr:membrane dipeptidase [Vicinamibacteria bacterium]